MELKVEPDPVKTVGQIGSELVSSGQAVKRLDALLGMIGTGIIGMAELFSQTTMPSVQDRERMMIASILPVLVLIFKGQQEHARSVAEGNDLFSLDTKVPWDKTVGLPSFASSIADARSQIKNRKLSSAQCVINSFSGWTHGASDRSDRCIGSNMKIKKVMLEVFLRHYYKTDIESPDSKTFCIKIHQLVGVKSEDVDSADILKHFCLEDRGTIVDDLSVVFSLAVKVRSDDGCLAITPDRSQTFCSRIFELPAFFGFLLAALNSFVPVPAH